MQISINPNVTAASFIARWLIGILFFMAGYWKVYELGVSAHAQNFFIEGFKDFWLPHWLLYSLGVSIPYVELAIGALVCIGFRTKYALIAMGILLIMTTYGHALQTPMFDITGHTFSRTCLILFVLMVGWEKDKTTIDYWLTKRS